jgi:putative SOS response-associated peptidase YedK
LPVVLPREVYDVWLDTSINDVHELQSLLKPYPSDATKGFWACESVNNVKHDDAGCAVSI